MEASVKLEEGMRFIGTADTGFTVAMDSSPAVGGNDSGFRPMELLLMGLCGCTAMDVMSILRKKREVVSGLEVKAQAEQQKEHPHVFTSITLDYVVSGVNVDPKSVERAIELSAERYCPAQAMLGQVATMSYTFRIVEDAVTGAA